MSLSFKGPIEGYAAKYCAKHLWRVAHLMDYEDCMQEAYLVYNRILQRYPDVEDKHFMALFKVALLNDFNTLSVKDSRERELRAQVAEFVEEIGDLECDGPLLVALRQAPSEVRAVLGLIFNAPAEIVQLAVDSWKPKAAHPSARVCKMLELPEDLDVMAMTRDYLRGLV